MLIHRRTLLKSSVAFAALLLAPRELSAASSLGRKGNPRLRLGLAAYSFRDYMKDASHQQAPQGGAGREMDLFKFIDYCADHGGCAAELTSYYFPKEVGTEFILDLKRHSFLRGIEISGTAVGNTFTHGPGLEREEQITYVKRWIDHAASMGAPHVRVFAGSADKQSHAAAMKNCISALEDCCDYAGKKGVFLGIENHGGIVSEPSALLEIILAVQSKWIGINLDSANFHTVEPYADFEKCAPFAVNVQLKTEVRPKNKETEPSDLKRYVDILKRANYQGYVTLEYEAAEDPFKAVPRVLKQISELLA